MVRTVDFLCSFGFLNYTVVLKCNNPYKLELFSGGMTFNFPRNKIDEEFNERESHLYSIVGLISHLPSEISCAAFGGYFRYDVNTKNVCDGQLVDPWGESEMLNFGFMDDNNLKFDKKYVKRNDIIHYEYKKNEKGIWEGEYDGEATGKGLTHCITSLVDENAFAIACGKPGRF
jgi:hypothetical protein